MSILRVFLIAATLLAIVTAPVLFRGSVSSTSTPSAFAAGPTGLDPAGPLYANSNDNNGNDNNGNGNTNDNNNNGNANDNNGNDNNANDNNGNDNNGNDNSGNDNNGNDNNGNDNNGNGNDNSFSPPPPPPPAPAAPSPAASKCFDVQEVGHIQLTLDGGTVAIVVLPHSAFPSVTNLTLAKVDPTTVPPPPAGTLLDSMVWSIHGQDGCNGAALSQLPADVNLGIPYNVPADKSKLQIARLVNGAWVDVMTVPDPSPTNPYISSTIHDLGTYAIYQKP